jgi:hypothetical protein
MLQGQHYQPGNRSHWHRTGQRRSLFLQRHPVLVPVLLLSGSLIFYSASFFSDAVFPVLAFIGIPSAMFSLSVATMLGIVGVLVGIISLIEYLDRYSAQSGAFSQPKERSYANRN